MHRTGGTQQSLESLVVFDGNTILRLARAMQYGERTRSSDEVYSPHDLELRLFLQLALPASSIGIAPDYADKTHWAYSSRPGTIILPQSEVCLNRLCL